jgi:PAS domain S-box-containing protein
MHGTDDTIRVLHVDDDSALAETAAAFVERASDRIEVETVHRAAAALDRLRASDVDCVVSDYDMPRCNGIELLEAVREAYPDLPFILFTGKGSEEAASDAISAGVTDYLQKERGTDQYEILAHRITNAVTASRSVAESEARRHRLEQILKTVPGCVVQLDTDGRFTYANRRATEVLGLSQSAVTDRTYNDPEWGIMDLDGDPIPDEELPFRRVHESGEPLYGFQHTIEWPDGTQKVLLVNGAPLFAADRTVDSVVFSLVDVTERYDRERTLAETERRLQFALEATDMGVWEWHIETNDVVWDRTLERVIGLDPGEFEGTLEAFEERVHPDDRANVRAEVERAVETDGMYETEFRMIHADGDVRWVAVRGQLIEGDDGRRIVGIHQNVTERGRLQSELAATTERYRTLVENVPRGGVFLYNQALECVVAGGAGLADVGLSPEGVEGEPPSERYPEPIGAEIESHLRDAFRGRRGTFEQTYQGRVYRISTLPVESPDGTIDRVMAVSREITDQKRRERELEAKTERLEEFAKVVSHDLRNPLRVVEGRLTLAREEHDSEHLTAAETAVERMNRIVEDVLQLAREGHDIGDTETVSLRERIAAAWEIAADGYENTELVVTDTGPGSVETVDADPNRLGQLLENLFRNSVEHGSTNSRPRAGGSDEDGAETVTVTVQLLEDGFAVADDGPGIPESARDTVFETGYSTSEEGAGQGAGLGLRIVKQVADAHGWEVTVDDDPDGGARFEITGVDGVTD